MTRSTLVDGWLRPSSTWFRNARLKSPPLTLARLIPRCCRRRRIRWPRVSCLGTGEAYWMKSRGLQPLSLWSKRQQPAAQPPVLIGDVIRQAEEGLAKRPVLRLAAAELPADDLQLLPGRPGAIAERHVDTVTDGPCLDRRRTAIRPVGAIAPVADCDR